MENKESFVRVELGDPKDFPGYKLTISPPFSVYINGDIVFFAEVIYSDRPHIVEHITNLYRGGWTDIQIYDSYDCIKMSIEEGLKNNNVEVKWYIKNK